MSRMGRALSETGLYHVTIRGCARQIIFEDDRDRTAFLDRMVKCARDEQVEIVAYCLMDNHVHMVLYDPESALGTYMQRLCTFYARYFNDRYGRTGHVFQDRFASEPIEGERYLLSAVRYVHDNPVKAGVATRESFRWSSYGGYVFDRGPLLDDSYIPQSAARRDLGHFPPREAMGSILLA